MAISEAQYHYRQRVIRRYAKQRAQQYPPHPWTQQLQRSGRQSSESQLREQSRLYQRRLRATVPRTVSPSLLIGRKHGLPPYPSRPSSPDEASKTITHKPKTSVSLPHPSSPYVTGGSKNAYMGGLGFSIKVVRNQLGKGEKKAEPLVYEPEPMEPLFGLDEELDPLPSPELEELLAEFLADFFHSNPPEPWEDWESVD